MNKSKRRDIAGKTGLLFFSIIIALMLAELILYKLNLPQYYHYRSSRIAHFFFPPDIKYHLAERYFYESPFFVNNPSQELTFYYDGNPRGYFGKENEIVSRVNSLGFRGEEFRFNKNKNEFRLIFLGDSITFGDGVKFEDVYSERTRKYLDEAYKNKKINFQSFNLGVRAYNTFQEMRVLRLFGLKLKPDIVVLQYYLNDPEPSYFKREKATNRILERDINFFDFNYVNLERTNNKNPFFKLRLVQVVRDIILNTTNTSHTLKYYRSLFKEDFYGWKENKEALKEIIRICREQKTPCYILIFPVMYQLNDNYPFAQEHEKIKQVIKESGGQYIDLFDELKGLDYRKLVVHPVDQHPNEIVHKKAAEVLVREIVKNKDVLKNSGKTF